LPTVFLQCESERLLIHFEFQCFKQCVLQELKIIGKNRRMKRTKVMNFIQIFPQKIRKVVFRLWKSCYYKFVPQGGGWLQIFININANEVGNMD